MRPSGHPPSDVKATTHVATEFASDQEWAECIRDGSYPAFAQLFHAYYEDLVRFVIGYVKAPEVAEGLVQDVFFNIWRGRHTWNPRGTLNAYLFGAARNHSLKYLRSRRALYRIKDELSQWATNDVESPDGNVQYEEFSQAVGRAIEALPERRRQVFKLSREQGLSYAEIAAVMGISVNTVENQMVRAMKTLRARLSSFLSLGGSMIVLFDPFFF
jgi:RNA polymerase sigma-70 factor (ECF subfamily)